MNPNKITFAITTYINNSEREEYLYKCIDSIINQTNPNWEILISDDNSPLNLDFSKYKNDDRVKIFKQEKNIWMFNWWNFLLQKCQTDWFIPMWDDDIVNENFVEICLKKINENKSIECIYFDIENINEKWKIINKISTDMESWFHKSWNKLLNYRVKNSLNFSYTFFVSIINTEKFKKLWWYKDFWTITDTYISYLIAKHFNIFYIKEHLMQIRKHKNNASNNLKRIFNEQKKMVPFLIKEFKNDLSIDNFRYLEKLNKTIKFRYIKEFIIIKIIKILNYFKFIK